MMLPSGSRTAELRGIPCGWRGGMVELLRRYVQHEIPQFWISDLRYEGSRFVHSRDKRRWRRLRHNPWAAEPLGA
ncbi:MAG TPA: hypothetical protein VFU65_09090 [Actinocrinis sp.]|nr:hypothetical protein [Actinocrinis sp.]